MHSGAKLLRKTLTGTERSTEHRSRKSKSLTRLDKKVKGEIYILFFLLKPLTFNNCSLSGSGWYTTCGDNETLRANCPARFA